MSADPAKTRAVAVKRPPKRRSRFGCRNCKLRKLKCDETKPQCRRCSLFGVHCNFHTGIADLHSLASTITGDKHGFLPARNNTPRPGQSLGNCLWVADGSKYSYQLNTRCQEYLTRYMTWRPAKHGDHLTTRLNARLLALSFQNAHLMHACLAVSMAYDRHLDPSPATQRRRGLLIEECLHRSRSIELFVDLLQRPVRDSDRDAVWATAASLAVLAFAAPAGTYVAAEQAWPLSLGQSSQSQSGLSSSRSRSSSSEPTRLLMGSVSPPLSRDLTNPSTVRDTSPMNSASSTTSGGDDLQWLLAKDGKMSLWTATNPLRADSIFSVVAPVYATMSTPLPARGVEDVHPALAHLCGLDHNSTACPSTMSSNTMTTDMSSGDSDMATETARRSDQDMTASPSKTANPFHQPLHALSRLLGVPDVQVTVGHTEVFTNTIHGTFRSLLLARDPRALLLLYLWYRKAGRCVWFVEVRARVEGPAICEYLRRVCGARGSPGSGCAVGTGVVDGDVLGFLPGGRYEHEECLVVRAWTHE